jgi:cysteinyl-tRNA synthetase
LDLERGEAVIRGIGSVTLRRGGVERSFTKSNRFPLQMLHEGALKTDMNLTTLEVSNQERVAEPKPDSFWEKVHSIEMAFHNSLEKHEFDETTHALLELDRTIWKAQQDLESPEFISQARDTLREFMVALGVRLASLPPSRADCLAPLVKELLMLRQRFRNNQQYDAADALRDSLKRADIFVEDSKDGSRWRLR